MNQLTALPPVSVPAAGIDSESPRCNQSTPPDEELKELYRALPTSCSRTNGIPVGSSGTKWDANKIEFIHNSTTLYQVIAGSAPSEPTDWVLDNFLDLISQYPAYLVNLANWPDTEYLRMNDRFYELMCPERGVTITETASCQLPSNKHSLYMRDIFFLAGKDMEELKIPTFEVTDWKSKKGLQPSDLHFLVLEVLKVCGDSRDPGVIHCRVGVGRTATLIIAIALYKIYKSGLLQTNNLEDTLKEFIRQGREQRYPNFVESEDQYISLYRYAQSLCSGIVRHTH